MMLLIQKLKFLFFLFLQLTTVSSFAYFYQINSETVNLPHDKIIQTDLKLLIGTEVQSPELLSTVFKKNKFMLGGYSLYQSARTPSYFLRYGPIAQWRSEILIPNLLFQFEYLKYQFQNSDLDSFSWKTESRTGLIYSRYDHFWKTIDFDLYAESFYIPEVSQNHLLSVFRTTILEKQLHPKIHPLAEIYLKDSPPHFGGNREELRLGAQWILHSAISLKLMTDILSIHTIRQDGILFQLNIFHEGDL